MWIFFLILCSSNAFFWNWWSSQAFVFFSLLLFPYIFHLSAPPVYGSSSVHGTVPPHSKAIHLKILSQLWRFGPNVLWQCVFSPKLHCHSVLSWLSVLVTWLTPNPGRIAQNSGIHKGAQGTLCPLFFFLSSSHFNFSQLLLLSLCSVHFSFTTHSFRAQRERERERNLWAQMSKSQGFPSQAITDCRTTVPHTATHTHTRRFTSTSYKHAVYPPSPKKNKISICLTMRILSCWPPVTHTEACNTHTHTCSAAVRWFSHQSCCVLSRAVKWFLGPLLADFDGSNTPVRSGSFYLPTKALTDGWSTVVKHCRCTCLICVRTHTQTHTHTHQELFYNVHLQITGEYLSVLSVFSLRSLKTPWPLQRRHKKRPQILWK